MAGETQINPKFRTVKIFGIEFSYRLISDAYSTNKNITINNENFGLMGRFLKLFEGEINELKRKSILTKDVFNIDFNRVNVNGDLLKINEQLSLKQLTENNYILYFTEYKNLRECLIQFNDGRTTQDTNVMLNFNYKLVYNEVKKTYDRMLLDFDKSEIQLINLLII